MGSRPSTNETALSHVLRRALARPIGLLRDARHPARELAGGRRSGGKACRDFASQAEAQAYFEAHGGSADNNVDNLDHNHNGVACEVYPYDRTSAALPPWVHRVLVPGAFAAAGWAAGRLHRTG